MDYEKLNQTVRDSSITGDRTGDRRFNNTSMGFSRNLTVRDVDDTEASVDLDHLSHKQSALNRFASRHQSIDSVRASVKDARSLLINSSRQRRNSIALGTTGADMRQPSFADKQATFQNKRFSLNLNFDSKVVTNRNSIADLTEKGRARPWLPHLATTAKSALSTYTNAANTQARFQHNKVPASYCYTTQSKEAFGERENPVVARSKKREKLASLLAFGGTDISEAKASCVLYDGPIQTIRNKIGVRTLKQTSVKPPSDVVPSAGKLSVLSNYLHNGPVRPKDLAINAQKELQPAFDQVSNQID